MLTVTIGGNSVTIVKNSLSIDKRIEERSTASFSIIDLDSSQEYIKGQVVEIYDEDSTDDEFTGFIDTPESQRLGKTSGVVWTITCVVNTYLADKRIAAESYESQTAGYIVDDLFDKYLAAEGVTIGAIQTGPTITQAVINYVRVSDAFDALGEKAGFIWYIDEDCKLYFIDRITYTAPWTATSDDMLPDPRPRLSGGNPLYRNRQYIRGGKAVTDLQTENRTGDGETKSFALGFPLAQEPTITVDSVTQTVGIKGVETGKDVYWNKGDNTIYFDTAPANTKAIVIQYYGQYNIIAISTDNAEIATRQAIEGGTGYVDDISDEMDNDTAEAAFQSAAAKLQEYCRDAQQFTYSTRRYGLKPGQLQTVNYPLLGLSSVQMLIESVRITQESDEPIYTITAVVGPKIGSWAKYFKTLSRDRKIIVDKLSVGEDSILIILVQESETTGLSEAVTETVYACPVPATTLYPSTSLYPC